VPTILALIRGLAEYERLAHEVEATAARLRRHGFGRRPYFETLIYSQRGASGIARAGKSGCASVVGASADTTSR